MSRTTRSLAQNDVVYPDDYGGRLGCSRWSVRGRTSPRRIPGRRNAGGTMVFLASIVGTRGRGRRGASESEIKVAASIPRLSFGLADPTAVVRGFRTPTAAWRPRGASGQGRATSPSGHVHEANLMLVRVARNTITDEERDRAIADIAERLA